MLWVMILTGKRGGWYGTLVRRDLVGGSGEGEVSGKMSCVMLVWNEAVVIEGFSGSELKGPSQSN